MVVVVAAAERQRAIADLEVEVRRIRAVGGADRADPLAAADRCTARDVDRVEVRIQRLDATPVDDADHVAPVTADIDRLDHDARRRGIDRVAEVGIAAAVAVPVVAEVLVHAERLRIVIAASIRRADREIESVARR